MELAQAYPITSLRSEALAAHLVCDIDEIGYDHGFDCFRRSYFESSIVDGVCEMGFLVLLPEERKYRLARYLDSNISGLSFTYAFLHTMTGLTMDQVKNIPHTTGVKNQTGYDFNDVQLLDAIGKSCGLIEFAETLAMTNGYGHYLDPYDNAEHKEGGYFIYRYY
ncbi:hypothetical protein GZH47_33385 (plasmid) [Paenibacillus rhizovicinus]|uniref:Uncharacterized protein n=1 Tax=Paenibacillus rhizovicinus TaxID=2704463 RepID=A0A6C0PB93_9BACL|nr:hypothetical protein [Paenibacillus rhizovicinus]QHW35788.1 hypothetical protein GZH47_33385 [Paenibacillus rhizovicinus]